MRKNNKVKRERQDRQLAYKSSPLGSILWFLVYEGCLNRIISKVL